MTQTVYADLYVVVNTGMDLLCLLITSALLHRKSAPKRLIPAALLGGLYALAALLLGWEGLWGLIPDLLAAWLITLIAYREKGQSLRQGLQTLGVFLLVSALMGGVMTLLYSLLNRLKLPFPTLTGDGPSAWLFLIVSLLSAALTAKSGGLLAFSHRQKAVSLSLSLYGHTVELTALVDTGNLLSDPISGRSVVAVSLEKLAPILPPGLCQACREGDPARWLAAGSRTHGARLISAHTAGGDTLLLALSPRQLVVREKDRSRTCNHLVAPVMLGTEAHGFDAVIGHF